MAGITLVVDPTFIVNDNAVAFIPNSITYDEGLGEYKVMTQTSGGGQTEQIFAQDVETAFSTVKVSLKNTSDNIALALQWKNNLNANTITLSSPNFNRAFNNMALTNNYEVQLGSETMLALEFKGNRAA